MALDQAFLILILGIPLTRLIKEVINLIAKAISRNDPAKYIAAIKTT